jgi:hypothetical protein
MKIGASLSVQNTTYSLIEAAVGSDFVFDRDNLFILSQFLNRTNPAYDGMAGPGRSQLLAQTLDTLKTNTATQAAKRRDEVVAVCRNLGRTAGDENGGVLIRWTIGPGIVLDSSGSFNEATS